MDSFLSEQLELEDKEYFDNYRYAWEEVASCTGGCQERWLELSSILKKNQYIANNMIDIGDTNQRVHDAYVSNCDVDLLKPVHEIFTYDQTHQHIYKYLYIYSTPARKLTIEFPSSCIDTLQIEDDADIISKYRLKKFETKIYPCTLFEKTYPSLDELDCDPHIPHLFLKKSHMKHYALDSKVVLYYFTLTKCEIEKMFKHMALSLSSLTNKIYDETVSRYVLVMNREAQSEMIHINRTTVKIEPFSWLFLTEGFSAKLI